MLNFEDRAGISGALNVVLSQSPYGPNVEEAKVRSVSAVVELIAPQS